MTAQELQNIERAFRTGLSIGFGFTPANYTSEEINKTWNNFKKSIDNGHFNKGYSADVYNDQLIINIPVEKIIEMTECDDLKVIDKDMFLSVLCDSIGDNFEESAVMDFLDYQIEWLLGEGLDCFEYLENN